MPQERKDFMHSKVIVDAFGGDNAPLAALKGAELAVKELGVSVVLCGNEAEIHRVAIQNDISLVGMEILNAPRVFDMHAEPTSVLKENGDTSLAVGLKALAQGKGDAFVSAGSTGAIAVGATFITKRIKGIKRPAIATMMPTPKSRFLLVDAGANADCRPEMLLSFGVMGAKYMELSMGVKNPRVGLLNNGAEDTKGDKLRVETYQLLKASPLNFVGNIEARDVMSDRCDVLVTDGFSGNIVLKMSEGVALSFYGLIKQAFVKGTLSKIAALMVKKNLKSMKKLMDYSEVGGAPLLGIKKPVIKAHGSSNERAFKNAIRQADTLASSGVVAAISEFYQSQKGADSDENA